MDTRASHLRLAQRLGDALGEREAIHRTAPPPVTVRGRFRVYVFGCSSDLDRSGCHLSPTLPPWDSPLGFPLSPQTPPHPHPTHPPVTPPSPSRPPTAALVSHAIPLRLGSHCPSTECHAPRRARMQSPYACMHAWAMHTRHASVSNRKHSCALLRTCARRRHRTQRSPVRLCTVMAIWHRAVTACTACPPCYRTRVHSLAAPAALGPHDAHATPNLCMPLRGVQ